MFAELTTTFEHWIAYSTILLRPTEILKVNSTGSPIVPPYHQLLERTCGQPNIWSALILHRKNTVRIIQAFSKIRPRHGFMPQQLARLASNMSGCLVYSY
ncbi:hypothetical protein TNCV_1271101 [Trichonephila clavipes]|nr:hypothetical protein TNCV_1271101 [Trichonephila clavipes]